MTDIPEKQASASKKKTLHVIEGLADQLTNANLKIEEVKNIKVVKGLRADIKGAEGNVMRPLNHRQSILQYMENVKMKNQMMAKQLNPMKYDQKVPI